MMARIERFIQSLPLDPRSRRVLDETLADWRHEDDAAAEGRRAQSFTGPLTQSVQKSQAAYNDLLERARALDLQKKAVTSPVTLEEAAAPAARPVAPSATRIFLLWLSAAVGVSLVAAASVARHSRAAKTA